MLIKTIKEQSQLLIDTAKKKVREYIVGAIFLIVVSILYLFRDLVLSLTKPILTKPPVSWNTQEILVVVMLLFLVAFIIFLLIYFVSKFTPSRKNKNILATDFETSHPTPEEIYYEIDKQPPLLRDIFAKNYIGVKVGWEGIFENIRKTENQNIFVGVSFGVNLFYFYSSLEHHPIFRTLKLKSAYIQVSGTIKTAINGIELKDCKIISIQPIIKSS